LDWIHELMDWIGLGQQKWTHVQLWLCIGERFDRPFNVFPCNVRYFSSKSVMCTAY